MVPALLTTCLFALTAVCATQSALIFGPERANMGRLLIAVVLLGLWAHLFGGGFGGGQLPLLFLAGMIGFGAGGWCMFQAFPRIGSTLALLVVECAAALVALLLGWLFLGAGISLTQGGFTLLILSGVVWALAPFRLPGGTARDLLLGVGFTALGALGQGISWVLTKAAFINAQVAGDELNPLTAAYQRLTGGFILAGLIFLLWATRPGPSGRAKLVSPKLVPGNGRKSGPLWMLGNALAGPVLGVSCMMWAIRSVGNPGLVQAIVATATLFSVPLARMTEKRRFRPNYFIGSALALGGVAGLILFSPSHAAGEPLFDLEDFPVEATAREPVDPLIEDLLHGEEQMEAALAPARLLERMPGMTLQSRGGRAVEPVLRGFSLDRVATVLDGVHLPLGAPTRTASPLNFFGPDPLLRVVLHGGLPSVALGPVTTGGRLELDTGAQPPGTVAGRAAATLNPDGLSLSVNAAPSLAGDAFLHSTAHYSRHGDYRSGGAGAEVDADYEARGLALAGGTAVGDRGRLQGSVRYFRQDLARNASLPLDTRDADALFLTSRYSHQAGETRFSYKLGFAEIRPFLTSQDRDIAPGVPLVRVEASGEARSLTLGAAFERPVSETVHLHGGVDLVSQRRSAVRQRDLSSGASLKEAIWPDIRADQPGIFLEARSGNARRGWRLGGRLERARMTASDQPWRTDWTGAVNAIAGWTLGEDLSLRGGIGFLRAAPGLGERYRTLVDALGGGKESGNPELDPERRTSVSFGLRYDRPGIRFTAEGWGACIDDYIQRQVINPEPLRYSFRNRDARFYGWEIQAKWVPFSGKTESLSLKKTGKTESLSLAASLSTVRGENRVGGQGLPDLPPWEARLSLFLRESFPWGEVRLRIEGVATGEGSNPQPEIEPIYARTPSHLIGNLHLEWSLGRRWVLYMAADNLFDKLAYRYLQPPVAPGPVRPSGGSLAGGDRIPLPGRSFRFGLNWSY